MDQALNPFTPGAGHPPPILAGRNSEIKSFKSLLNQRLILQNPIITGLRGIGKTVLLRHFQPIARANDWVWVGAELSESVFVDEEALCKRLIADLSFFTSTYETTMNAEPPIGFHGTAELVKARPYTYHSLIEFFKNQPGLLIDKIKATFEITWPLIEASGKKGIIFAYDEAQVVADQGKNGQYPLSLMLALFQSLQSKGMKYMLLLSGLPTLFPKLVEARTYTERMFTVIQLTQLSPSESKEAILGATKGLSFQFSEEAINRIIEMSHGYPYFIQFIASECFEHFKLQREANPHGEPKVPEETIISKLDTDFFMGRWMNLTERQKEFMYVVAKINSEQEFSNADIVDQSNSMSKSINSFSKSHISQILPTIIEKGLIYKTRYGKYALAIPMFRQFILRQFSSK